ncbi:tRNA pseudouridine55 synthase [Geosmithia morbida]|uniref:tRNA pseudouridine(55) synthase n=1 Tax=Geosmithia morbida TaxID=1094350 RepID=A0A9P5D272_9HYPO|nr:tRNA pseudouridine55 synthase [Geosmithia morbida]KAF4120530.1 tRNA pseudouridine55 synthase [Geosmithia morbida]
MASDVVREGCLAINKPCGMSSAQVIRDCQIAWNPSSFFQPLISAEVSKKEREKHTRKKHMKRANQVKIGHGGTLDPLATGVLILGIGSGTKALPQFLDCVKTYETTVLFGASTDTYDRVGRILAKRPYDHITRDKVEEALEGFRGKQMQVPPLYSALKMNGKPLYEYAREGKPIPRDIEARQVEVKDLELVEWYEPGQHPHRWPAQEAEAAERNLAEQVWRIKKQQETSGRKTLTPEEKEEDDQAIAAHESFKRRFEERQDALIRESGVGGDGSNGAKASKKTRKRSNSAAASGREPPMMSGALGKLPEQPRYSTRGQDLVPDPPSQDTPPPWTGKGPAACRIRMTVTSGFYVRSFCHDLGAKLDSAGLMAELSRTRQSDFTIGGVNCLEHADLAAGEAVWGPKVSAMLARWNGEPSAEWKPPSPSPPAAKPTTATAATKDERSSGHSGRSSKTSTPPEPEGTDAKEYHRPFRATSPTAEKRRRSATPDDRDGDKPARKVQATGSRGSPTRDGKKGGGDDSKSWDGLSD